MSTHVYVHKDTDTQIYLHSPPHIFTDKIDTYTEIHPPTQEYEGRYTDPCTCLHMYTNYRNTKASHIHRWNRHEQSDRHIYIYIYTHMPKHMYIDRRRQTQTIPCTLGRPGLRQAMWGEYVWEGEAALPIRHRLRPWKTVASQQRLKMGLKILVTIIISNVTSYDSKQDPDALVVYVCFLECYI